MTLDLTVIDPRFVIGCIWLFLPAGMANMSPVIATKIFGPGRPIDAGRSWRGQRLLGDHKTWQGLVAGSIVGGIVFLLQQQFLPWSWATAGVVQYNMLPWFLGFLLGFGALAGDAVKSFFKRRVDIEPGKAWIPFDQLDFVIGGIVLALPFALAVPAIAWLVIIIAFFALHPVINILGWALRLKKNMF